MATFAAFISNWGEIVMKTFSEERYNEVLGWLFEQFPSYQVVGDRAYKPGHGPEALILTFKPAEEE